MADSQPLRHPVSDRRHQLSATGGGGCPRMLAIPDCAALTPYTQFGVSCASPEGVETMPNRVAVMFACFGPNPAQGQG